jgi:hypothetical protein
MNTIELKSLREPNKADLDPESIRSDADRSVPPTTKPKRAIKRVEEPRIERKEPLDDRAANTLDDLLEKSSRSEPSWRDRNGFSELFRDVERMAGNSWRKAADLLGKFRPNETDKPLPNEGDDTVPPAKEKKGASRRGVRKAKEQPDGDKTVIPPVDLTKRYLVIENRYHFREDTGKVAFEDKGKRLTTDLDDRAVVGAMVELALSKDWGTIRIKGSDKFKQEAWLAASMKGIEVENYKPREIDVSRLEELRREAKARIQNAIEKGLDHQPKRAPAKDSSPAAKDRAGAGPSTEKHKATTGQEIAIETLRQVMRSRGDSELAVQMAASIAAERLQDSRSYVGKIIEHGPAPYANDPKNDPSYFVKLETKSGPRTVWGVDLQRALETGKSDKGDEIALSFQGARPVSVKVKDIGEDGKPNGERVWVTIDRSTWQVDKLDDMREEAAKRLRNAFSVPDRKEPVIPVFDSNAPRPDRAVSPIVQEQSRQPQIEPHVQR